MSDKPKRSFQFSLGTLVLSTITIAFLVNANLGEPRILRKEPRLNILLVYYKLPQWPIGQEQLFTHSNMSGGQTPEQTLELLRHCGWLEMRPDWKLNLPICIAMGMLVALVCEWLIRRREGRKP